LFPWPRSYDGTYTEIKLSCIDTDICIQSAVTDNGGTQLILVTPLTKCVKPVTLLVSAAILWNKEGYTKKDDDALIAITPSKTINIFASGKQSRQLNTWLTNPYIAIELSESIIISTNQKHLADLQTAQKLINTAKEKVITDTKKYGALAGAYNAMRTCLAWDTIYEPEKDRVCSPVSRLWNINWGGYILFDWDTYFASLMQSMENKELALANARAITNEVTESGFIPNYSAADNYASRDRSQPPVASLVIRHYLRKYQNTEYAAELYPTLLGWNAWFDTHRRILSGVTKDCFAWGSEPFTPVAGGFWELNHVDTTVGGALESGMDNSPMYDDIPFDSEHHIMYLADVGLTSLYILDCECLSDIAKALGKANDANELLKKAQRTKAALENLWDEDFGFYCNRRSNTGEYSHRIGTTNFYALFSDAVSAAHKERIINEHFYNVKEFYGKYIIPTIARNDAAYKDQDYWRGRIWAPTNFLTYLALQKAGCKKECSELSQKGLNLIMQEWLEKGHVHENFNGDTGVGCDVQNSDKFYHWGGLLSYIALIENGYEQSPV
jgi:neutral trehalase